MMGWLKNKRTWAMTGVAVLALAALGFAFAWQAEQRNRVRVEHKLSQTISAKHVVEAHLAAEQDRSQKLAEVLDLKTQEVERVVKRLEEETHTVETLQGRLQQMETELSQVHAELILTRQQFEGQWLPRPTGGVELGKIRVGSSQSKPVEGRVMSVNDDWQFVVVNLGWEELSIGDVLGIYRGEELIAKVRVERVQDQQAAASVLPEYRSATIAVNDRVTILSGRGPS